MLFHVNRRKVIFADFTEHLSTLKKIHNFPLHSIELVYEVIISE